MADFQVTVEDLLVGANTTYAVVIPPELLPQPDREVVVQLRPVTIGAFQLIMKAARQDAGLIPLLLIKESVVQPSLSLEQVKQMHLGIVNFLIGQIRTISGLAEKKSS